MQVHYYINYLISSVYDHHMMMIMQTNKVTNKYDNKTCKICCGF